MTTTQRFQLAPGGRLRGTLRIPGDKSISHRAIMLGALADGTTHISGFLEGADSLATVAAFRAMGVSIDMLGTPGEVIIEGVGRDGLKAPATPLDMGNSGTSMRLLSGLLAAQPFVSELTGDDSLTRRPMRRVTEPLAQMGAKITTTEQGTAPLKIAAATSGLHGIDYHLPVPSAQVKSSLILAGLYASGTTCITEPAPTRDHTERMLTAFGYPLQRNHNRICVNGGGRLHATTLTIPGDISSAAFFMVGASIAPDSDLTLEAVGVNPTRTGVIAILRAMGADITLLNLREFGGEPVADIRVRSAPLHGIRIAPEHVPLAIDEFPALFIAAACAEGETILRDAAELRVKESDRIQVMAEGLTNLGIEAEALADGIRIRGGCIGGGTVTSYSDHRIAMAFAMAALRASAPIEVQDCANVSTSFPGFAALAGEAGLQIAES